MLTRKDHASVIRLSLEHLRFWCHRLPLSVCTSNLISTLAGGITTSTTLQGNLEDMLEDCNTGISWVMRHISSRGGDPNRLYIVGQSAGGQLGALTLIAQACAETADPDFTPWNIASAAA